MGDFYSFLRRSTHYEQPACYAKCESSKLFLQTLTSVVMAVRLVTRMPLVLISQAVMAVPVLTDSQEMGLTVQVPTTESPLHYGYLVFINFEDIDECGSDIHMCDTFTSSCVNSEGGYSCDCLLGFEQAGNLTSCEGLTKIIRAGNSHSVLIYTLCFWHFTLLDVDECSMNNGACEQLCNNTIGSFDCYCVHGYNALDNLCEGNVHS